MGTLADAERKALDRLLGEIGENLQAARLRKGMTQSELADAVEVDPTHIRAIEGGRGAPSLRLLVRLGLALGVTVRDLFAATKPRKRNPGRPRRRK